MTTSASPAGPLDRHGDARRGLVVGPRDHVDRGIGLRFGCAAGIGLDDDRVADERVRGDRGGELGAELAEGQVQRALVDESERRGVPERGRAAVAEDDLVAVGQREQLADAVADAADEVLHRRLAVRRAEQVAGVDECLQLLGAHLRRTGAEAAVLGLEFGGNRRVRPCAQPNDAGQLVRMRAPSRVMATVCSLCAARAPVAVRSVQPSESWR